MNDLTIAISAGALEDTFGALIEIFSFQFSKSTGGSVQFSINVQCHFERGQMTLMPPDPASLIYQGGYFDLSDVVIKWDRLDLGVTVHIPGVNVGGFCLLPTPWGCAIQIPPTTLFDVDITATIPIDNIVDSRLDLGVAPVPTHVWNSDLQTYQWLLVPHVVWQELQLLDIADTVADLIDGLITNLVNDALGFLPDWAKDIIDELVGGLANLIRGLLSLPTDLQAWLSNLLRVSLDPFDFIVQLVENYFQNDLSLYSLNDPMAVLPKQTTPVALPAVTMPITNVSIDVDATEVVIGVTS